MLKSWWGVLGVSSLALCGAFGIPDQISAKEVEPGTFEYSLEKQPLEQVTSVSQLRDVFPGDWAYEALRNLVETYGCIAGYPDGTFQGNRAMTRYEFAAGLNACLEQIQGLIAANTADITTKQDWETLQRLLQEFAGELTTLRQRIDNLETRSASLQERQFSTTTKLTGEAVFSLSSAFGDEKADNSGQEIADNLVFNDRVRLFLKTSFTGKDLLLVRLDALNAEPFGVRVTGTNMSRLSFDLNTNNQVKIGNLFYRFPLNKRLRITLDAVGRYPVNLPKYNPFFANPITGSISRFGRFNPIYYQGILGAGVTATYKINDAVNFSLGYLARNSNNPEDGNGLFNGSYGALAQLGIKPNNKINLGLTYVRAYYPGGKAFVSGATGSRLANAPFGSLATSADQFGFQSSFRLSPSFTLSGWLGVTLAHAETGGVGFQGAGVNDNDNATIVNWAVTLAFPDLGKKGNLAGFVFGNPPRVTSNDSGPDNPDTPWHLEGFYRYSVTDNISIAPGLLVIINPEGNSNNDTIYVGTIRTVFKF
ncbi:MAG: iron uptake porin [Calothrix sp. MO_192.B10]|nr:iron uptake porin [Calothrix sp. MO_192.B10]